jgi:hypothetical protein
VQKTLAMRQMMQDYSRTQKEIEILDEQKKYLASQNDSVSADARRKNLEVKVLESKPELWRKVISYFSDISGPLGFLLRGFGR